MSNNHIVLVLVVILAGMMAFFALDWRFKMAESRADGGILQENSVQNNDIRIYANALSYKRAD